MFIGHHAAAFAGKAAAPRVSLGTLMFAAMFLDLLRPFLTLAGLEHFRIDPGNTKFTPLDFYDYPISHSLAAPLFWSIAAGGVYFAIRKSLRDAVVRGAAVLSHRVLDFVTHRPDLPLDRDENYERLRDRAEHAIPAFESDFRTARPRDRDVAARTWQAGSYMVLAAWLFVPWAWWCDRHRQARA